MAISIFRRATTPIHFPRVGSPRWTNDPDATPASPSRGPKGHDEWNQARGPGNFGWPYFVGNNKPYIDYDFATGISGSAFSPAAPTNNSSNNTGPQNLPPAQPAWLWYP